MKVAINSKSCTNKWRTIRLSLICVLSLGMCKSASHLFCDQFTQCEGQFCRWLKVKSSRAGLGEANQIGMPRTLRSIDSAEFQSTQ